jgi:hypothetical protein
MIFLAGTEYMVMKVSVLTYTVITTDFISWS